MTTALILTVILAIFVLAIIQMFVTRFKRCPSNKILVIYGKTGRGVAKCVHGGAAFVWPVIQSSDWLDLDPFDIPLELTSALSHENIRVSVPTTITAAVSTEDGVMQNAAIRLLGRSREEVQRLAQDIILGQMRAVMATMRIEEINRDRIAFMAKVNEAVAIEIEKIGLSVINVNIKDVEDESGYIKALGRKAAAEAINQAMIDVAEQEKLGKSGVAERERDTRRAVAAANAAAAVGEAEAERDRRQQTSLLDAQAVETETTANASKAGFQASQKVAEEEARAKATTAAMKADGAIRVAQEEAQKVAEEARGRREQARLNAEVIVPAEAAKQKAAVDAEAMVVKMQAEAKGQQAILDGKAAGYRSLVAACAQEPSLAAGLLLIEKLVDVVRFQTEAIKNLPIEKIVVWDGGGDGGISKLGQRIMGALPPMHELAKMSGLELPEFLGRIAPKNEGPSQESFTSATTKETK